VVAVLAQTPVLLERLAIRLQLHHPKATMVAMAI
jgi:hypothetical protein